MPALVKKYPLYVSDEPVTYLSFVGGINTDPSNEHILPNELRDGLNVHFQSGGLVKRKGAKILSTLISSEDIENVQSVSIFTNKMSYLVIAANGKLYYGIYTPNAEINLTRLKIDFYNYNRYLTHNPVDMTVGLIKYDINNIPPSNELLTHEGYVLSGQSSSNFLGSYLALPDGYTMSINDVVLKDNIYYKFIGGGQSNTFTINFIKPTNNSFWIELNSGELSAFTQEQLNSIALWDSMAQRYFKDDLVAFVVSGVKKYYRAFYNHIIRNNLDVQISDLFSVTTESVGELIFQNYQNIEGATYNNTLYLATGTRIVEIYPDSNGKLLAYVLSPKLLNSIVLATIGFNYVSPYPELCMETETNQAITSIGALLPLYSNLNGVKQFVLKPIMTIAANEELQEYYFRWEKFKDGKWLTVKRFQDNFYITLSKNLNNSYSEKVYNLDYSSLIVNDADEFKYRVTFAKSFEIKQTPTTLTETEYVSEEVYDLDGNIVLDYKVDKAIGDYFGQATSVLYNVNLKPNQLFKTIHSCKKVYADGNKFCFYDDAYNSGEWFKTVIDNPNYITLRGGLSFKTNKNEALVKVISFAGYLIAFANSTSVGGSIHLVQGNGDDVENDQFYSPYRRKTISPNVSCDNPNTVQVAENLLFFKHFDTIYFIQAGELDQDKVNLYSANDRFKDKTKYFTIPWEDNNCVSELTEDYYALMWPEKNIVENGEIINVYPASRIKLYYKMFQRTNNKAFFPWLRDESELFNIKHLFYINAKPIYLYNNTLVTMNGNNYTDFNEVYPSSIRLKAYDLEKPKMYKLLDNVTVFYNRNQYSVVDVEVEAYNEAGHKILNSKEQNLIQDKKTLTVGDKLNSDILKLDSTIIDSKVVNSSYKFPFLLIEVFIKNESEETFSFSSITFNYTTVDIPDQNPYELYSKIIRN
jgi:hypothetical protein